MSQRKGRSPPHRLLHPGMMVTISEAIALDPDRLDIHPLDATDNVLIVVFPGSNVLMRLLEADPVAGRMQGEIIVSPRLLG